MDSSIDVIIPSFRLYAENLKSIFEMDKPSSFSVNFYVVIDNPDLDFPTSLALYFEREDIHFIYNQTNLGAHLSRNIGLDSSSGDWVLFLDDDIIPQPNLITTYAEKLLTLSKDSPGVVGVTEFPKPINSYTRGIVASDILTFFSLPRKVPSMSWGVTANIVVRRSAIGVLRFSEDFPKSGGGEDIDLFLRIQNNGYCFFSTLPNAIVYHPWWGDGKRSYSRFFRWAYGDSLLPRRFENFRYYNFPNAIECSFFGLIVVLATFFIRFSLSNPLFIFSCILLSDVTGEYLKIAIHKQSYSPLLAIESSFVRLSNDLGRFVRNLQQFRLKGIGERFDYFCTGEHVKGERIWASIKLLIMIIYLFFSFAYF